VLIIVSIVYNVKGIEFLNLILSVNVIMNFMKIFYQQIVLFAVKIVLLAIYKHQIAQAVLIIIICNYQFINV